MINITLSNAVIGAVNVNSVSADRDACNLRVKTSQSYMSDEGRQTIEDWHEVAFFGKKGRFDNMLEKVLVPGNRIALTADRIKSTTSTGKDGKEYTNTTLMGVLSTLEVVYFKQEGAAGGKAQTPAASQPAPAPAPEAAPVTGDDDIPF